MNTPAGKPARSASSASAVADSGEHRVDRHDPADEEGHQQQPEKRQRHRGQQPGDPLRAADAMIDAVEREHPPRHFVLGKFGIDAVTERLRARLNEIEAQRAASLATDFLDGEG